MDGVNYFHVKVAGLLFVATTRVNVSPSLVLELLQRIARVIKDYLGILNEDSLRKNFVLVYELLDEVIVSRLSPHHLPFIVGSTFEGFAVVLPLPKCQMVFFTELSKHIKLTQTIYFKL